MTLRDALISVWRQTLVDGLSEVQLGRRRYPVGFTRGKHLRTVAFRHGQRQFFGIEQNPRTRSRWAALAREGKRVMQFRFHSQYVANVCDGKLFRYPAWRMLKLQK
jgi:hypothetical protein